MQNSHAQTTPSPSGTDLKVKPMLGGRLRREKIHIKADIVYVKPILSQPKKMKSLGGSNTL